MSPPLAVIPINGMPETRENDNLGQLIIAAAAAQNSPILNNDILVVTQKIVSKAEGRVIDLRTVTPSPPAQEYANAWLKDPRIVEVALRESVRIVRMEAGVLITETPHGFVCANSGVDASNVGKPGHNHAVLLPNDPDLSAARIRQTIRNLASANTAVIISDTFGRPWREGAVNVAIGASGIQPLSDYRGQPDNDGRELHSTVIAVADELAAAAELVMRKLDRAPVAIIRGYPYSPSESGVRATLRESAKDLFR